MRFRIVPAFAALAFLLASASADPRTTITPDRIAELFARADALALPFVTFPELTATRGAGLAFAFDDAYVDDWFAMRDTLAGHPITLFVSNYLELSKKQLAHLRELAADGHAIEAHGTGHRDAALYVDAHGLARYLVEEIDPLVAAMQEDGFTPTTFAYPYGSRTHELDTALLERFALLRSLTYLDRSVINTAPCPR